MPERPAYRFCGYHLDPVRRVVSRNGELLPIPPKVVDTLIVLVEHAGEVVDKDTLMQAVWPDTSVVESSLTRNISLLRKALSEATHGDIIQTVSKRGYRFLPTVETRSEDDERLTAPVASPPPPAGTEAPSPSPLRGALTFTAGAVMIAATVGALVIAATLQSSGGGDVLTEAEREYILGRHFWNKIEPTHVERALQRFQRAAELDPNSAPAHAGIADSHVLMIQLAMSPRAISLRQARMAAERASALDRDLASPHVSLGYVAAMSGLDLPAARREFERAVEIGVPAALPGYGDYLTWIGDLDGARRFFARAKLIDPVSPFIGTRAARLEYFAGRYAQAIELLTDVLEREPSFSQARYYLALSHAFEGRIDAALGELRRAQLNRAVIATDEAWIRAVGGDPSAARALITERRAAVNAGTHKWTVLLLPAISVGDRELAIRALEGMWHTREIELLHLKVDPRFEPLRSDPRFQDLARRVFHGI